MNRDFIRVKHSLPHSLHVSKKMALIGGLVAHKRAVYPCGTLQIVIDADVGAKYTTGQCCMWH